MSRIKEGIAVYNPQDPWEKAIQDASKQFTDQWLPSFPCQLLAKAVGSLKIGTGWLDQEDLLPIRSHYLFAPYLTENKEILVFVTHLLYLRDILENRKISFVLHNPIVFMSQPMALFLFRDNPVHILVNSDLLRAENKDVSFLDIGGLLIGYAGDVSLESDGLILDIRYYGANDDRFAKVMDDIERQQGVFLKAAAKEVSPDIFAIEEHYPELMPDTEVWDKVRRSKAQITGVEPSENGNILMEYSNGNEISVPKQSFYEQFVVMA